MRIRAIIVNFRTPGMTADAVDALTRALDAVEDADWRVAVVDNDSGDDSIEELRAASRERGWGDAVEVIESGHNGGFGYGNNLAIRRALAEEPPPDFVYLLNSDAFPAESAIVRLVDYLSAHDGVGIAGSYIHGVDGTPHGTVFRFPSIPAEFEESLKLGVASRLLRRHVVSLPIPDEDIPVDWVAGCSMLIRREVFEAVGLFDETFFLYFEETDLCRRAAAAGFGAAYVRSSHVAHVGSASTGMKTWDRTPTFWFDSRRHYFVKQHGRSAYWAANAARLAGGVLWRIRCAIQRRPIEEPARHLRDMLAHAFGRGTATRAGRDPGPG